MRKKECKKLFCKEIVGHKSIRGFCYKHRLQPPIINESVYDECKCGDVKIKIRSLCKRCEKKITCPY